MLGNAIVLWKPVYWDSIHLPFRDWAGAMFGAATFSGVMAAAVAWVYSWLKASASPAILLCLLVAMGAAIYVSLLAIFDRAYLKNLVAMVRGESDGPATALAGDAARLP
jgi:hypothetical protein